MINLGDIDKVDGEGLWLVARHFWSVNVFWPKIEFGEMTDIRRHIADGEPNIIGFASVILGMRERSPHCSVRRDGV